ncbi:MAG TPA: DUF1015 domain-containing protein [Prevotellaceae bacterium]|nr:DUF1015 domain-containing protein [Prevotellaceae bacterium]
MARVKPFRGLRPPRDLVEQVECRPYDVLDSDEARAEAGHNEKSLYHIIKPEIDFPAGTSEYDPRVYRRAAENFAKFQREGWLVQDSKEMYYVYAQTMNGHTQYGLVVGAAVDDYMNGVILRHELTRKDKEEDRMRHVRACDANLEPVFLAYPDDSELDTIVARYAVQAPVYDFIAPVDGFRHQFWLVDDDGDQDAITRCFARIPHLYIADGHHRTAAAALVGVEKAKANPHHTGNEEYNYLMAVCFPASQLTILDYNRVVKDLNGHTPEEFLALLGQDFTVTPQGVEPYRPARPHEFSLYLRGMWYSLALKPGLADESDPVGSLDVSISSKRILDAILGIRDLRSDKRIDFVGGLRGLGELKRRVDSGEMQMALALYPVSMQQIIRIADSGKIMPPKATWFEPKLRSGLVVHKLS